MATNLNITANSTSVSSNNFSITVTDNNTGNVVNISPPTSPIVSISAAGILGNPGKDSDVIAGESVIFQHITASGEISASGIVYGSQINIDGGIFTSASLASAEASGDDLGNHTATQNLNLDGNSLLDGLNITASGGIRANNVDVGDVSGISSIYDLRVGGGGIRTSGTGYFYGISNPSSYTGAGRITLSDPDAYIQIPSYVSASRAILTQITASGDISSSGDLSITGESFFGSHITASGNISASGNIISNTLTVDSISSSNIVLPKSSNSTLTLFSDQTNKAAFLLNGRSNEDSYLSMLSGQKLGIGLAVDETPSSKLTISGDLKVSSHITASGDISASANVYANRYYVDGKLAIDYAGTSITYGQNNQQLILRGSTILFGADNTQHVTASGNISASGDLNAANITTPGTLTVGHLEATTINTLQLTSSIVTSSIIFSSGSNIFGDEIIDTHTFNGHITASGNISSSGNITAISGAFSYIQGNSPLTINPDQLIVTPNDYFQVLTGGTTSSIFVSQSSGNIGFNTNDPQTGFDAIVNEAQFQKPGTRTGLKINDEGNIESFSKDANTASTGSEFLLRFSRGTAVTKASLESIGLGPFVDDTEVQAFFNGLKAPEQNSILERIERIGFIDPPQVGDTLGSIRWVAESGSISGYDDRSTGETAVIKAVVSDGAADGIAADLIFSVAGKTGAAQQKLLLDAFNQHQLTGSLNMGAGTLYVDSIVAHDNAQTKINVGTNDMQFFANNSTSGFRIQNNAITVNEAGTNYIDFFVEGDTDPNLIATDASTDKVGIGTSTPSEKLTVEGNISASGEFIGTSANITNITASGNISASALIEGIGFRASGNSGFGGKLHVGGTTVFNFNTGQIFKATGTAEFTSHITSSGNISASGDLMVNNINGTINGGTF